MKRYRVGVKHAGDGTSFVGAAIEFERGEYVLHSDHEAALAEAVAKEREACLAIILDYQVPVGNSAAGEMACDWTMDALKSIRDAIRARSDKP